ncbi:Modulator protein MzrA|nr:Modulator protein MzrA [Candidatus Pantoea persica]
MKIHAPVPRRMMLPWLAVAALLLLVICLAPMLLRHDTMVQIRVSHAGGPLPDGFHLYQQLTAKSIRIKSIKPAGDALIINFENEVQSPAA